MDQSSCSLGLVGAGRLGRRYIETIRALDGVSLALVASRNPETPAYAPNARVVPDWMDLLVADLDGVIIATPPTIHGEMLRAFVEAAVPVMVEKPLCLDINEACELRDFVQARGVPVLVDHTQIFHPAYATLKRYATDLGPVAHIFSEGMGFGPFRPDVPVLWDWSPHDISLCLDLMGTLPESVSALGDQRSVTLALDFGTATAWINNSNVSLEKRRSLAVYFENHALVLNDRSDEKLVLYHSDSGLRGGALPMEPLLPISVSPTMPLAQAVSYFVEGLSGGDQAYFGLDLACDVVRTVDAAQSSIRGAHPRQLRATVS